MPKSVGRKSFGSRSVIPDRFDDMTSLVGGVIATCFVISGVSFARAINYFRGMCLNWNCFPNWVSSERT